MRLGILGGSFDPPHVGHLLIAQDAIVALALDRLVVVPAATQPLKQTHCSAAVHRLAMLERCFDGVPKTVVDPVELDRGGLSFMVDTVDHYRQQWPSAAIHLLIGEDVVETLPRWREPERLLAMVQLVVLRRVDRPDDLPASGAEREMHDRCDTTAQGVASIRFLATRRVDVSSTEIRARVLNGRSIRGFVTDAVAEYIATAGLYL